jgi:hypothetical protein
VRVKARIGESADGELELQAFCPAIAYQPDRPAANNISRRFSAQASPSERSSTRETVPEPETWTLVLAGGTGERNAETSAGRGVLAALPQISRSC